LPIELILNKSRNTPFINVELTTHITHTQRPHVVHNVTKNLHPVYLNLLFNPSAEEQKEDDRTRPFSYHHTICATDFFFTRIHL